MREGLGGIGRDLARSLKQHFPGEGRIFFTGVGASAGKAASARAGVGASLCCLAGGQPYSGVGTALARLLFTPHGVTFNQPLYQKGYIYT